MMWILGDYQGDLVGVKAHHMKDMEPHSVLFISWVSVHRTITLNNVHGWCNIVYRDCSSVFEAYGQQS
jgi:hypothetical protein